MDFGPGSDQCSAVQSKSVVPYEEIAYAPLVSVNVTLVRGGSEKGAKELTAFGFGLLNDFRHMPFIEYHCLTAADRMREHEWRRVIAKVGQSLRQFGFRPASI